MYKFTGFGLILIFAPLILINDAVPIVVKHSVYMFAHDIFRWLQNISFSSFFFHNWFIYDTAREWTGRPLLERFGGGADAQFGADSDYYFRY